jgi:hypothetical protein
MTAGHREEAKRDDRHPGRDDGHAVRTVVSVVVFVGFVGLSLLARARRSL